MKLIAPRGRAVLDNGYGDIAYSQVILSEKLRITVAFSRQFPNNTVNVLIFDKHQTNAPDQYFIQDEGVFRRILFSLLRNDSVHCEFNINSNP